MMGFAHGPMAFPACGPHHGCVPYRECWREAKELLVRADVSAADAQKRIEILHADTAKLTETVRPIGDAAAAEVIQRESGTAVIGGGCCVHLSVEYMPALPAVKGQSSLVRIVVVDTAGTRLSWYKEFEGGYHVAENIISTNPGAVLAVAVTNAIARVRWCEVFCC